MTINKKGPEYFEGCLLGGAVGDALGAPVEFLQYSTIQYKYGNSGIRHFEQAYGTTGAITDDTQMALFTAEGLLRARTHKETSGDYNPIEAIRHAYRQWLITQTALENYDPNSGFLINQKELHQNRAPGNTCLSALRSRKIGTLQDPINNSKGCGAVMRVAPVGLACSSRAAAFALGAKSAAITHGHPNAYLSAGFLSVLINTIIYGADLNTALNYAHMRLKQAEKKNTECSEIFMLAEELANNEEISTKTAIRNLGEGWVSEEAVAIALYCVLKYPKDFNAAVTAAVNHSGDSDSTGAIAGNIMGALLGKSSIDPEYLEQLEMCDLISQIAIDLEKGYVNSKYWHRKYPGFK